MGVFATRADDGVVGVGDDGVVAVDVSATARLVKTRATFQSFLRGAPPRVNQSGPKLSSPATCSVSRLLWTNVSSHRASFCAVCMLMTTSRVARCSSQTMLEWSVKFLFG